MKQTIEEKRRYKQYKAGKHWVTAPIIFFGVLGVVGFGTENAQAAELDNQPAVVNTQPESPGAKTVSEPTQNSTTSQPTTAEEVAPKGVTAEQSSAIPNDTTNTPQAVATSDESVKERPVVTTETPSEPLGQPTEVAPAENEANKSTTIPKEFETPDVDKSVDEAKKDPNITV
ncbi:KxYKxGKxW signal peptide domain-containing protein, partial [Enterococcus faecalis]|uniref:KxYKxGKxW signal peptide domain-containing protein n=1 Tax=Enterococcus faecalis TaxID=1351 RepID=UPI0039A615DA